MAPQSGTQQQHPPAKRVAVLLDSAACLPPESALIESLKANPLADVTVVAGFKRKRSLFQAYLWLETIVLGLFVARLRAFWRRRTVSAISPSEAGLTRGQHLTNFDVVIDLRGSHIHPQPQNSTPTTHFSLKFADLHTGKAGPAGFWEMISGAGASGIFLMNGPTCVFKGRYKTKRLLSINAESAYREGLYDIGTVLNRFLSTGIIPEPIELAPSLKTHCRPGAFDLIKYKWLTVKREGQFFYKTRILGQAQRFGVEVFRGDWTELALAARIPSHALPNSALALPDSAPFRPDPAPALPESTPETISIPNPKGRYFADPFLIEHQGKTVCFVEDYNYAEDKGRISAVDLTTGSPVELGCVIEEPFHMSFPFVFKHEDELYMVPETYQDKRISVYRCTEFPFKWERHKTIMDDVEASDSMLFKRDDRWWMLTNLRPEGCVDFYSRLYAFYADSPFSTEWTPHDLNPILVDAEGGRNAGILRDETGQLHRVGQHQGMHIYGRACSVRRITQLSPSAYREELVLHFTPDIAAEISDSPTLIGTHHIAASANWTAFDTLRWERP